MNLLIQEQKDLLLKDLSARLPYKVYVQIPDEYGGYTSAIESIDIDGFVKDFEGTQIEIENIKPYLFPLSSMTEEQKEEYRELCDTNGWGFDVRDACKLCNWLNKYHLDYNGLIDVGLAIDCTNLNIY